jgi:hypothetical protein
MSEARAAILAGVIMLVFVVAVCAPLMAMNVPGELIAMASLVPGGLGAYAQAWIVMRYSEKRRQGHAGLPHNPPSSG